MRIALTIWQDRIAPVFDVSREATVYETGDGEPVAAHTLTLNDPHPAARAQQLADAGVAMLVCGAISRCAAEMLAARKIEVVPFVAGRADEVLQAALDGSLDRVEWTMPGCRRGGGAGRGRRRRGMGRCRFN